MSSKSSFFRALPDEALDHAIGKLERLVRSLKRDGTAPSIAAGYEQALDQARGERERRVV